MPQLANTHTAIRSAKAKANGDTWYSLIGTRGLWLRVGAKGQKAWVFRTTANSVVRKVVLGHWPQIDFDAARNAMNALRANAGDSNPIDAENERIAAEKRAADEESKTSALRPTVATIGDRYLGQYVSERRRTVGQKRSAAEDKRLYAKHIVPLLGHIRIEDLRSRDIAAARDAISARSEKRKALAVLRAVLSHAKSDGLIDHNVALGIKTPQSGSRDRVLTDPELKALWNRTREAIAGVRPSMVDAMRVQLLTGQRIGEVLAMRWTDLNKERASWLIPSAIAKNGRENVVPLSPLTADIVFAQTAENAYVFPGHRKSPVSSSVFAQLIDRVRIALELEHFTSHDLRRTAATRLAALGILPHVVEAILNHSGGAISGIAAIYNRHSYDIEKRRALNAWARELERIADGREREVVERTRKKKE